MLEFSRSSLPIMEIFYTIQGEGYHTGRPAIFIRTAGCDVGCAWCDVKESWSISDDQFQSVESVLIEIEQYPAKFIVITGGEPLMHDLSSLTKVLNDAGYEIAIETSGTVIKSGLIDWYCFSPKKFKEPVNEAYFLAKELKIVINHKSDFTWAEKHAEKVSPECLLYLQPEWSKMDRFLPQIIDYVKENPKWKISLQTHKFMNIP